MKENNNSKSSSRTRQNCFTTSIKILKEWNETKPVQKSFRRLGRPETLSIFHAQIFMQIYFVCSLRNGEGHVKGLKKVLLPAREQWVSPNVWQQATQKKLKHEKCNVQQTRIYGHRIQLTEMYSCKEKRSAIKDLSRESCAILTQKKNSLLH